MHFVDAQTGDRQISWLTCTPLHFGTSFTPRKEVSNRLKSQIVNTTAYGLINFYYFEFLMLTVFIFFTAFEKPHENSELKYFYYKIHKTRQKTKVSIAFEDIHSGKMVTERLRFKIDTETIV